MQRFGAWGDIPDTQCMPYMYAYTLIPKPSQCRHIYIYMAYMECPGMMRLLGQDHALDILCMANKDERTSFGRV